MPNYNYKIKLKNIRAFALDVDGVLTDGSIVSMLNGKLLRTFYAKDGFAIRMCSMHEFPVAIITGGFSESIEKRFLSLGIPPEDIYQKSRNKLPDFMNFCERYALKPENVAFMGDDIPDIGILKICGLAVAPADAAIDVKEVCDYVSPYPGGKGCVRDLIEQTLKVHGKWSLDIDLYARRF